jgi:hypothetical protein
MGRMNLGKDLCEHPENRELRFINYFMSFDRWKYDKNFNLRMFELTIQLQERDEGRTGNTLLAKSQPS